MIMVSRLTRSRIPRHAGRFMVRLHTPESVALDRAARPFVVRIRPLSDAAVARSRAASRTHPCRRRRAPSYA